MTTEGVGKELVWELEIGAQRTGQFEEQRTSYHPPIVAYYRGEGSRDADTAGGQ